VIVMRKILVPIAYFEACRRALEFGGRLAKAAQADLTVLHVQRSGVRSLPLGIGAIREKLAEWGLETGPFRLLRQAEESLIGLGVIKLDEQIRPVEKHSLRALDKGLYEVHLLGPHGEGIRFRLRQGDPVRQILQEAEEGGYDLLITGTRGYRGLKRLLVGSIAAEVALRAPCSVLVAKNLQPYQGLLVGTDGSSQAREAVRQAGELAELLGTRLMVLAAVEGKDGTKAEAALEEALGLLPSGLPVEPVLAKGDPLEELIRRAGEERIIIVGRGSRFKVGELFSGSLPARLLERATSPVLIVASSRSRGGSLRLA